jgi:cobalt/nickel transport system ATP-binding protein
MKQLFSLQKVSFSYPGREVLNQLDFELNTGERVALVGENGAGKSSLLQLMVGLHPLKAGKIIAYGEPCQEEADFRQVRLRTGMLFQDPDDQLFCPTVLEDVIFGPLNQGLSQDGALLVAHEILATLGLDGMANRVTHKLSGGEKRLVSLATVLAMRPEVLLLDEPTNGLDEKTEQRLIEYLQSLPQAMVFVSHDRRFVEKLATRAVVLKDGRLKQGVLYSHAHAHLHVHAVGEMDHDHADVDSQHSH